MTQPKYHPGLQELIDFYNALDYYLIVKWKKIPLVIQSFIKIIICIFIMAIWTCDAYQSNWSILSIPILICIYSLGLFYTYYEIGKQLEKHNAK